jgi:hypothetical protein
VILLLVSCLLSQFVYAQENLYLTFSDPVIVNNVPVFKDVDLVKEAGPSLKRSHRTFGSQYGRMVHLKDGSWVIGFTTSRNQGYNRNEPYSATSKGGLELEMARSCEILTKVSMNHIYTI